MLGSYVFCYIFCLGSYGFLSFCNGFLSGYFGFRGFVSLFAVGSSLVPAGFRGCLSQFAAGSSWVPAGFCFLFFAHFELEDVEIGGLSQTSSSLRNTFVSS